jgi:hypothetical protein
LLLPISGCSSEALQQALAPDPNAGQWGKSQAQLPADFPTELRFDKATLQAVSTESRQDTTGTPKPKMIQQTRWVTSEPAAAVQSFYQDRFQRSTWKQVQTQSAPGQTTLTAWQQQLRVKITIPVGQRPANPRPDNNVLPSIGLAQTQFEIAYYRVRANSTSTAPSGGSPSGTSPALGPPLATPSPSAAIAFADLHQAPSDLQPYLEDLAQLGVLTPADRGAQASTLVAPTQAITRGTFAQWLVQTNNRLYRDRPTRQIRLPPSASQPVFTDVPSSSPLFPYIQGLAEAGYLPSPLSGDPAAVQFRPHQPLTRETLLIWKVPVDQRRILPTATAAKVQQIWGFKDANQISPAALAAILADHQNGDLANVRRVLGSALLLQPQKTVTRAEAAAALWFIGMEGEGFSAKDVLRAQRQIPPSR